MMNYLIAFLILAVWCYVAVSFSWTPKVSPAANLFAGLGAVVLIGIVHWLPFWLIFMK